MGLLSPSQFTEAGYRLYSEEDFYTLQQILALKFLGFSLEEIKGLMQTGPKRLQEVLAQQKAMMTAQMRRLTSVIQAIEDTESLLQAGQREWDSIVHVIQAIQMGQNKDWAKDYFTEEQQKKMEELSQSSYSEAARQKLSERQMEWTEEDQKQAQERWAYVAQEADHLAASGADPAGPEAQALAKVKYDLLHAFTQGDGEISAGLNTFWEKFNALPQEEKPFDSSPFESSAEGTELLNHALAIYTEKQER